MDTQLPASQGILRPTFSRVSLAKCAAILLLAALTTSAHAHSSSAYSGHTVENRSIASADSLAGGRSVFNQASPFENLAQNRIFLELMGSGGVYSVNYERHLTGRWSGRIGYAQLNSSRGNGGLEIDRNGTFRSIPITVTYLTGRRASGFELGAGTTLMWDSSTLETIGPLQFDVEPSSRIFATLVTGYRLQPENRGMLFRVGFTPLFGIDGSQLQALPWGGVSIGYAF